MALPRRTGYKPVRPTAMGVRVIAGHARGRRLRVAGSGVTRPTSGLVRGALFYMLAHRGWLAEKTLLLEHHADEAPAAVEPLAVVATRRHGDTVLTLLAGAEARS